jgi:hypothetical protein
MYDETLITFNSMMEMFKERNKTYSENYRKVGTIMAILFPDGISLEGPDDFVRFHFLDWIVGKLTRYAASELTHEDSMFDLAVYAAMLATFTRIKNNERKS